MGKKNTTVNSSTGNSNTDTTSGGLVQSPSSNPTATPGVAFDAAKIRKNTEVAKRFIKKFNNGDDYIDINGQIPSVLNKSGKRQML